jgi:hypothetical protein
MYCTLCFYSRIFYFLLLMLFSSIAFVINLWILWGSTFFIVPIVRKNGFSWCYVKKRTTFHDVTWDVFMSIVKDANFHLLCGYIHIFLSFVIVFTSMRWHVVLMDGGCCLMSSSLTSLAHIWFCKQFYLMGLLWYDLG